MKLLIATTNPAKIAELSKYFAPLVEKGFQLVSLADVGITEEPEETGETIQENAMLKARYYGTKAHLPCVADDGGFEIDFLNGEPGVNSKRWMGRDATDDELIAYTLERLQGVPYEKRTATGVLFLCYFNPENGTLVTVSDRIEGIMSEKASDKRINGFPYRALFVVKQFNKLYDDLSEEEHAQVNHRKKCVDKLIPQIEKDLVE